VWNDDLCLKWGLPEYCKHTADHLLEFTARVPIIHTEQLADCMYFRVESASFPEKTIVPYCNKTISTDGCQVIFKLVLHHSIFIFFYQVKCKVPVLNEILNERAEASATTLSFGVFAFLMLTSWVAMAVVTSVGDAICFGLLGSLLSMQNYLFLI
jgi:hypothetical protein